MKPTDKAPEIDTFLNHVLSNATGESTNRRESIKENVCAWCKGSANEFSDELSRKEFTISGFCQKCQDEIF